MVKTSGHSYTMPVKLVKTAGKAVVEIIVQERTAPRLKRDFGSGTHLRIVMLPIYVGMGKRAIHIRFVVRAASHLDACRQVLAWMRKGGEIKLPLRALSIGQTHKTIASYKVRDNTVMRRRRKKAALIDSALYDRRWAPARLNGDDLPGMWVSEAGDIRDEEGWIIAAWAKQHPSKTYRFYWTRPDGEVGMVATTLKKLMMQSFHPDLAPGRFVVASDEGPLNIDKLSYSETPQGVSAEQHEVIRRAVEEGLTAKATAALLAKDNVTYKQVYSIWKEIRIKRFQQLYEAQAAARQ